MILPKGNTLKITTVGDGLVGKTCVLITYTSQIIMVYTDCFLLCYLISNKSSYDNIVTKWYPELKTYGPQIPIILIATKCYLRGTLLEDVTLSDGKKLKSKIRANKHVEYSALKNQGLNEIFVEAVRCAAEKPPVEKSCTFL